MQHPNRTGQTRIVAMAATRPVPPQQSSFYEIATLSLAGLALTVFAIAHGVGPDLTQLTLLQ